MANPTSLFALIFLLSFCFTRTVTSDEDCVYTVYVRTGSIIKGGTDSIIGLKLYDAYGYGIYITDLEAWGGLMGPGYNYYERGNLDIFSGKGPCLDGPVCAVNLTSDGSGAHHGWYCNYVEVTSTGVHIPCAQEQFTIEQWLATDTSPYELSAVRNYCSNDLGKAHHKLKIVDAVRSRPGSGPGSDYTILRSIVRV
ncbi:lipoxygenase y domain-containing protein 1-like [Trifolium pratense]|uniref:Lipoxygenase y domain-containing protein 1-like n=1 Tax=Trifolium pratense TaxID=57577 RepID=A0A2K3LPJ7_TRIPR|nr:PLAT domain-containing protein 3-like [Trifolium pratense]PNX80465.1 lipoxygenase y domain-containing protein 1-like [Trifolium pratense]